MSYHWKFKAINGEDYRIYLTYPADKGLIKKIFNKTVKSMRKKTGMDIKNDPKDIKEFNIPENQRAIMFPVLYRAIKKHMKEVFKKVKKDGIKPTTGEVVDAIYKLSETDGWHITVVLGGHYAKNEQS